jgi:hypothetical protein
MPRADDLPYSATDISEVASNHASARFSRWQRRVSLKPLQRMTALSGRCFIPPTDWRSAREPFRAHNHAI